MKLVQANDGCYNLFMMRDGDEYYRQKSEIFLNEFTTLAYKTEPQPPQSPMIYHDVAHMPLPFEDNSFDHIYSYHIYEHLFHNEADFYTAEIFRVLKPGGIYRASAPNMEMVSSEYLKYLDKLCENQNDDDMRRYYWTVLKLIDQGVREVSGGLMLEAMRAGKLDKEYVKKNFGESYAIFFDGKPEQASSQVKTAPRKSLLSRILSLSPEKIKARVENLKYKKKLKKYNKGLGADLRTNRETVSLLPDEIYLKRKLEASGFTDFSVKDYKTSNILHWEKYDLDRSNNGDYPYDPSVYVEAVKGGVS